MSAPQGFLVSIFHEERTINSITAAHLSCDSQAINPRHPLLCSVYIETLKILGAMMFRYLLRASLSLAVAPILHTVEYLLCPFVMCAG